MEKVNEVFRLDLLRSFCVARQRCALILLLFGFGLLVCQKSMAAEMTNLHEASIPVLTQEKAEREKAFQVAFSQVVTKITGNVLSLEREAVKSVRTKVPSYVLQYQYEPIEQPVKNDIEQSVSEDSIDPNSVARQLNPTGSPPTVSLPNEQQVIESAIEEEIYRYNLWIKFSETAIEKLLIDAGLPVWVKTRPSTLIWLGLEENGQRQLVGGDFLPELQTQIKRFADERGLPLLVPLMDIEDQMSLRFTDVWGNFQDTITTASERYGADVLIVARVFQQTDGLWQSRWSIYEKGQGEHWRFSGSSRDNLVQTGINESSKRLASRYAVVLENLSDSGLELEITDVESLDDYARVMKYLSALDSVKAVTVIEVSQSSIRCRLVTRGPTARLLQTVDLGGTLMQVADAEVKTAENRNVPVVYRLRP